MQKVEVQTIMGGRKYTRRIREVGLISSNEAATLLGITIRHLYNLTKSQRIIPIKRNNRLWFRWKDVEKLAEKRR